jgi:hypothetical protein
LPENAERVVKPTSIGKANKHAIAGSGKIPFEAFC